MSIIDRMWFAVQTWPRYEKKVASELGKKGMEVFLPLQAAVHKWSDRRRMVQLPLFPNYVFVRIPERQDSRIFVLRTNGVANFVGSRRTGTPIPESEIESVRVVVERRIACKFHPFLNAGDRVRIRGGCLDGVEGILVGGDEKLNLVVSINIIQRSLVVSLSGYRIEAA